MTMADKFAEYPQNVPYSETEAAVLSYWNEHGIFHKSLEEKPADRVFPFMKVLLPSMESRVFTMCSAVP